MTAARSGLAFVAWAYITALAVAVAATAVFDLQVLWAAAVADGVATAVVLAFSVKADNTSIYDPYWSVAPPIIAGYWIITGDLVSPAHSILLALVLLWSIRLTGNWIIRWNGRDDEDWRYREFRKRSGRWYWLVSFLALHLFPTVVVFLGLLPVYFTRSAMVENQVLFTVGCILVLVAVALESVADRQLRSHRRAGSSKPCERGVWSIVRHPNYFGELTFWLGLLVIGYAFGAPLVAGVGFLAMCGVFFGYSIPAMDRHLEERYASN